MATIQDYREARRTGSISLTNLIARNIAEGGGFGSVGQAISQKIKARGTRIKEAFDPLNIASMLVGRSKLGTAILGRMMGRGAEDIQYFARKGAGRDAAYDPFFARSPRSLQPVRQNEGMADIYAKLYALIKKQIEEENKRKETQENFQEEREIEDERRHKEMLVALRGKGKGKATPVAKKEGGGLLDLIKGLFGQLKSGLLWLFTAVAPLIAMLGKGLLSIFQGLLSLGLKAITTLASFMATPFGAAILAGGVVAYLAKEIAESIGNWEKNKLKDKGGQAAVDAQKEVLKAPTATPIQETYDEFGGTAVSDEAQMAAEKRDAFVKEKQDLVWKKMAAKGYPVRDKSFFSGTYTFEKKSGEKAPEELVKAISQEADVELEAKRKKATSTQKKGTAQKVSPPAGASAQASAPAAAAPSSSPPPAPAGASATPSGPSTLPSMSASPAPSLPATPPVATATDQNIELESESMYSMQSAPMVFNKSSTNGINLGGQDTGTATGAAPIRDDAIEDIINKLQRRASVM
jgi:hypothetical protein